MFFPPLFATPIWYLSCLSNSRRLWKSSFWEINVSEKLTEFLYRAAKTEMTFFYSHQHGSTAHADSWLYFESGIRCRLAVAAVKLMHQPCASQCEFVFSPSWEGGGRRQGAVKWRIAVFFPTHCVDTCWNIYATHDYVVWCIKVVWCINPTSMVLKTLHTENILSTKAKSKWKSCEWKTGTNRTLWSSSLKERL